MVLSYIICLRPFPVSSAVCAGILGLQTVRAQGADEPFEEDSEDSGSGEGVEVPNDGFF